jgi:hypothetical protein
MQHFDSLTQKADYEVKKQTILMGILESLKTFKNFDFGGQDPVYTKKLVKGVIKKRILEDELIFARLKNLILLRDRDRSMRENSIKILKKLVKFTKKTCKILLDLKIEVFVSFILEREYRHQQVVKERL